ncbi:DUF1254 domain-containing protein [Microbacterium sp. C7(2022)]|uniref:DUF1254 domain-containing protein n=1 Tax=Microbacterium sp. C7(2022) TaxID=2992759 RepID=UPI00237BCCAE|nr:DUF1254 domain-containing protein [Microbacterium sp. C7(2022)]MDE0547634.1 DUF1254 domain-containing protein [Microbacterium sp. C7(2022)]
MTEPTAAGLSAEDFAEAIASLSLPDTIPSPFGDLEFFDGVPLPQTVGRAYDALDLLRGIDVFLNAVPGASLVAFRAGLRQAGVTTPREIGITEPRATSKSLLLTPNTETTYGVMMLDLKAWGPTVIEAPPQSLCVVDDFWFRYVADMGIAGPDGGAGGTYLFLPPGYDGDVPEGYFTYRTPTFTNFVVLRALGGVPAMKQTKIYPLAEATEPTPNTFVNFSDLSMNTIHSNDFHFFEEVAQLVNEEPAEALDAERAGQLAAIGISHGQPFEPDERLRDILQHAALIGAGIARVLAYAPRDPDAVLYGSWRNAFVGGSYEFLRNGARLLDARTQYHYMATVITPAMAKARIGAGSAYAYALDDADGNPFDGAKTYRMHVDAEPPAKNFWAVDLYDTQTRSLLIVPSTDAPALASNDGHTVPNDDGSYDLYFGPTAPEGKESNWVETIPGKSWFPIFRAYGPLEAWFDQSWKLNDIELVGEPSL